MNVLHLCNDFLGSRVHYNLVKELSNYTKITVYCPIYKEDNSKINSHIHRNLNIIYSPVRRKYHRYFYNHKIRKYINDIKSQTNVSTFQLIHATNWCFDGAIAYELYKSYNIPYVIAIRGTDVNVYYKKLLHKRNYFLRILLNAKKIIFISPSYKNKIINGIIPRGLKEEITEKVCVKYNGINDCFLDSMFQNNHSLSSPIKFLFTGRIQKQKNLLTTILAFEKLIELGININLTIVGKPNTNNRAEKNNFRILLQKEKDHNWIELKQVLNSDDLIKELRNHHVFIMNSFNETFGLVYIEALTQGLPIIYSKHEGIDGIFEDGYVGYSTLPSDCESIIKGILLLKDNYVSIKNNIGQLSLEEMFRWKNIAKDYLNLYKSLV